jgi:hypothetical protein
MAEPDIQATVVQAPAEDLPFPDASFDAVLSVHVLCSVGRCRRRFRRCVGCSNQQGRFRFFDHVRCVIDSERSSRTSFSHCGRNSRATAIRTVIVAAAVERAGFEFSELESLRPLAALQPMIFQAISRPHLLGVAVRKPHGRGPT